MKVIGVARNEALASGVIAEPIGHETIKIDGVDIIITKCPAGYTPTYFYITDDLYTLTGVNRFRS